ncbi:Allene oxide synthase [Hibiscus syriacus]|uniref:Allene oxide synthase n=1 Tax=Hibiscus syriacus TaxID=106335 RepID=A0A6A2XWZ0_HIBSY|nr:Allene oxide synthase [Hibiscus syriacus]
MAAANSPASIRSPSHPVTVRPNNDLSSEDIEENELPLREIPGDYGLPFFGAIKDRLDYFYNQGPEEFFRSRIKKYNSTVFRNNMPPGPFISSNPKVITLLDAKSFPVLFDLSKVEKKDLFTGTYMPSTKLTGGYRILSYLDPSEPNHTKFKQLLFFLLKSAKDRVFPAFESSYTELFETVEKEVAAKGKSNITSLNEAAAFNFLGRAYYGSNPPDTKLGNDGPTSIAKWVLLHLAPVLSLGLPIPNFIEDLLLHTFPIPPFLVKRDYKKLYDFIYQSSGFVLDEAEKMGISRDEACHNLLHTKLGQEIRSVIKSNGGKLNMAALEQMTLTKSVVYETLRIDPPVPFQYGKAKKDLVIESHDASFKVKKGEMLFGYQPIVTKDPKVFERAEEFVPDRFVGPDGEKLLEYVFWSNGRETEIPSVWNKQCAGKEFVILIGRLFVVQFFRRYETFEIDVEPAPLGATVSITSVTRARSY